MRCHDRIAFATPAADCRIFCSFGKNVNEIRVVCVYVEEKNRLLFSENDLWRCDRYLASFVFFENLRLAWKVSVNQTPNVIQTKYLFSSLLFPYFH